MTTAVSSISQNTQAQIIEKVMIEGDLGKLSPEQRVSYYKSVCDSLGLNPLTKPFDYIVLNSKLTLYARKDCTDQLRNIKAVSVKITAREKIGEVYVVTAAASMPGGRTDESTGAVALGNLRGDALANAYMKAETKAKRRVTLSICGLGMLDETEADTTGGHKVSKEDVESGAFDAKAHPHVSHPLVEQPKAAPAASEKPGDWIIPFGKKFKGMKVSDVEPHELASYCEWIEDDSKKSGKPVSPAGQEFMDHVVVYLNSINWKPESESDESDNFDRSG